MRVQLQKVVVLLWFGPLMNFCLYQVVATPWFRMSQPGWMDWVLRHHDALPACKLPVCNCCMNHIVGKNPQIWSVFLLSAAHEQHNYATTAAWFTGWNLFCSVLKGWLLFRSLLQPKTSSFPPLQLCPKLTYGCFVGTRKNVQGREDVWQSLTISASGRQGHSDSTVVDTERADFLMNEAKLTWN